MSAIHRLTGRAVKTVVDGVPTVGVVKGAIRTSKGHIGFQPKLQVDETEGQRQMQMQGRKVSCCPECYETELPQTLQGQRLQMERTLVNMLPAIDEDSASRQRFCCPRFESHIPFFEAGFQPKTLLSKANGAVPTYEDINTNIRFILSV